jgi:hypothetical protein
VCHHLDQEAPRHRIESLCNIYFKQNGGRSPLVQFTASNLHEPEVVMYSSPLDESALIAPDEPI